MSFVSLLSSSPHRLSFTSVVLDFSTSPNDIAPVSPIILPVVMKRNENGELLMDVICVSFFLLFSPLRLSAVSVLFDFNDSINDNAPFSQILFTVDVRIRKECIAVLCHLCVFFFLLSSPLTSSSVSVVFDFNDSLIDVAPESLILLPFYAKRKEKSDLLTSFIYVSFLHNPD